MEDKRTAELLDLDDSDMVVSGGRPKNVEKPKLHSVPLRKTPEERLAAYANQDLTMLSIPVYDEEEYYVGEYGKDMRKCTNREFFDWLQRVYPVLKEGSDHKPEDYKEYEVRERAFKLVVERLKYLKFGVNVEKLAIS